MCDWHALEADAPGYDKPSVISSYLSRLIVLGLRYSTGVACSPDAAQRQYSLGRTARHLEESTAALAYWMEERACITALLSAVIPDLRRQPQQLFFNLTVLRQGSFTGCALCELVCPLGEDYAEIESSASRRGDLPEDLAPVVDGDLVRVRGCGRHRTG